MRYGRGCKFYFAFLITALLLKNRNNALPIDAAKVKTMAVIGDDAGPNVTIGLNGSAPAVATSNLPPVSRVSCGQRSAGGS